jgi:hypothetical protein
LFEGINVMEDMEAARNGALYLSVPSKGNIIICPLADLELHGRAGNAFCCTRNMLGEP